MPSRTFLCKEVTVVKNIFSLKLYIEGLKKIKTAGIAAAITVIALNAIVPTVAIIDSNMSWPGMVRQTEVVSVTRFAPFNLAMMVFAAILVYAMFSFLNERNKCDFWHAIPQTRTCVYFSFTAAVWTWILGIIVASSLVNVILWAFAKYYVITASSVLMSAGVYFLAAVMMAAFMTLSMTVTGTTVSNLLIMALLMLFVRVMGFLLTVGIEELLPILDVSRSIWRIFEIEFCLPISLLIFEEETFSDGLLLGYSALVVAFVVAAGAFFYHRRKSEMATKSAPSTLAQHIYRCAVTLPFVFLMVILMVIDEAEAETLFIVLIVSLLVWTIYELMTTKKFKNVIRSLPVLIVPVLISLLLTGAMYTVRGVVLNNTPDADEIKGVTLATRKSSKTYEQLLVDDIIVENDQVNATVANALEETVRKVREENRGYIGNSRHLIIHLKSGKALGRYVSMDDKTYALVRDGFYQSEEYRAAILSLPSAKQITDINFSSIGANKNVENRLWASFVYEYSMLDDAQKRAIKEYNNYEYVHTEAYDKELGYMGQEFESVGTVYISGSVGGSSFSSWYPILYAYMPETARMYLEVYNEVNSELGDGAKQSISRACEIVSKALENPDFVSYGYIDFNVLCGNSDLSRIHIGLYSDEKEKDVEGFANILNALNTLSDPEDYSYDKSKTVIYCSLNIESDGALLSEENIDFEKGIYYNYYMSLPIALTEQEAARILDLYMEKTPA